MPSKSKYLRERERERERCECFYRMMGPPGELYPVYLSGKTSTDAYDSQSVLAYRNTSQHPLDNFSFPKPYIIKVNTSGTYEFTFNINGKFLNPGIRISINNSITSFDEGYLPFPDDKYMLSSVRIIRLDVGDELLVYLSPSVSTGSLVGGGSFSLKRIAS